MRSGSLQATWPLPTAEFWGIFFETPRPFTPALHVLTQGNPGFTYLSNSDGSGEKTRGSCYWCLQVQPIPSVAFDLTRICRGIGLAVTRILLQKFNARVVALARGATPELLELMSESKDLIFSPCDV